MIREFRKLHDPFQRSLVRLVWISGSWEQRNSAVAIQYVPRERTHSWRPSLRKTSRHSDPRVLADIFQGLYKEHGLEIEILHHTELLSELWQEGKLDLTHGLQGEPERIVTYHDPCYIGRYHGVYDAPRSVLEGIQGLKCVEMEECRDQALCCGGGGGRMWLETEPGARQSDLRVGQATRTGADTIITACPYCIQNFEDSTKVLGANIIVKDIAEIVAEAAGLSPGGDGQ